MHGIYGYNVVHKGSIDSQILTDAYVDGVAINYSWASLEPQEGSYNWKAVDNLLAQAAAYGKKFSIAVQAGDRTPSWVYADGAQSFQFVWDNNWGAPLCSVQAIPVPWDPVFLSKWNTFVQAFGARYQANQTISSVIITGTNGETVEASLPHTVDEQITNGTTSCTGYDDVANWQALGYTRILAESAWEQQAADFVAAFPGTQVVGALVSTGFPPIDDNGNIISGETSDTQATLDLLSYGINTYGRTFIGSSGGLTSTWIWPALVADASIIDTGYQTATALGSNLPTAMNLAISDGAMFLELYESDLLDPSLQSAIASAHQTLQ